MNSARTVGFVSDRVLAVISQSKCCSRIKRYGIVKKNSFCRPPCIIYEEALCAERLKETRMMDGHLLERRILWVQVNLNILNVIGININEHDEIFIVLM